MSDHIMLNQIQIARQVRIAMKDYPGKRVTQDHMAVWLGISQSLVSQKYNGHVAFTAKEVDKLAQELNVKVETLTMQWPEEEEPHQPEPSIVMPEETPEAPIKGSAPPPEQPDVMRVNEVVACVLIAYANKTPELTKIKEAIFRSFLTGRIKELKHYLSRSLYLNTVRLFGLDPNEREDIDESMNKRDAAVQDGFTAYYLQEYSIWKAALWTDLDPDRDLMIESTNRLEIINSLGAQRDSRVGNILFHMVQYYTVNGDEVKVKELLIEMRWLAEALEKGACKLEDYLAMAGE